MTEVLTIHLNQIAKMKTQTVRKTAQAKKGSATRVVRRKAAETEDDDDTRVKKMVQVRRRVLSSINKKEMGFLEHLRVTISVRTPEIRR